MLEVRSLSKQYNSSFVVKDISFTVPKGEVLVLLGTSGCGKTTTLKMINRLINKTSGSVYIDGEDTSHLNPHQLRRNIGYVIQETGLFPHYTIGRNISTVPELLGWNKSKINARVDELLMLTGLGHTFRDRMPHELSGGQRQRVGLARALAADPSLILLDEPFGALDPISRKEMQHEFIQLEGALDKAMVLVTHDVIEAIKLADQICLMDQGEVQQIGNPKSLVFNPSSAFVKQFFADKRLELEPNLITLHDISKALKPTANLTRTAVTAKATLRLAEVLALHPDEQIQFVVNSQLYVVDDVLKVYYQNRMAIIDALDGMD